MISEKRGSGCDDRVRAAKPGTNPLSTGAVLIAAESRKMIVARSIAHLRPGDGDVDVREVRDENVTGVFARNGAAAQQPAVIVLGGSEGGLFTARWAAPILASRGFAVLGLGYFQGNESDLSSLPPNLEHIPLETLEAARGWLARQPGIDSSRIALVGVSKGAELALVAGATFPWVTAVAAFTPTHVVWEGIPPQDQSDRAAGSSWTYKGKPLPFVRWSKTAERRSDVTRSATGSSRMTDIHLESLAEFASDVPAATIPIERSQAAFFVAAGTDDGVWPAAYSAELIQRRLAQRRPDTSAVLEIHATGHLVMGTGWGPTTQFQRSAGWLQGGNARLDAQAQRAIWPSFLSFLELHLRANTRRE
jgi:dienelactone hydrolase